MWAQLSVGGSPLVGDKAEGLNLLVGGEVAVDFVDDFLEFLLGFGEGEELFVVAIVEVVFERPVVEGVEVGGDDDAYALFVLADDHGLVDVFGLAEFVFEQLRGDVFTCGELEDVFLAVGDAEVFGACDAADEFAHVACVEPAVGVDDLGGVFGVFEVAEHDVWSAGEDFAIFGEGDFDAAEHGADGADADIAVGGVVDGDDGGGFGEAVAFVDVDAGGGEGAYHAWLDAAGACDDDEAVAAEAFAPMAVDHVFEEALGYLVAEGDFFEEGVVVACAMLEGAGVDFLFQAVEVLAGGIEFVVYHLEHTWHGAEAVGVDLAHVLLNGAHVFGVVDADAFGLEVVVHAALVHVVEGQEAEDAAVGGHGVDLFVCEEVGAHVAVGEHDALGVAGGAGGVDEGGPIVGFDGLLDLLHDGGVFLAARDARLEDFEHAVLALDACQGEDGGRVVHLGEGGTDAIEEDVVADEDVACLAVIEDIMVVVGAEGGIDGHVDDTGHCQRHVDEVPLGAVGGHGDDAVAAFETKF